MNIDKATKHIAIYNPQQIKFYVNEEKLKICWIGADKNTNRAYVTFLKDDATFKAYIKWLEKCKEFKKVAQSG